VIQVIKMVKPHWSYFQLRIEIPQLALKVLLLEQNQLANQVTRLSLKRTG
jgi:hypothetical protein